MKSVRVPAFAKVNLCLDVVGRRTDGYHELRTIFQAISLHDTLDLEFQRRPGIELRIAGNSTLAAEPGSDNLVYRAIQELMRELGVKRGIRAVLTKRIPVGRGLGGGSSDAAAALIALLRLTGKPIGNCPPDANRRRTRRGCAFLSARRARSGNWPWRRDLPAS